jgi:ligand-binding SRPBCC domain-containing protein
MKTFLLNSELWVPRPIAEVFEFFADARNLEKITPDWINFSILTSCPIEMRAGALIEYRLKVHGIPLGWLTEITAWGPPNRFVDEQRRGPYRLWVHEHRFSSSEGGTLMTDSVRYAVWGGALTDRLFVRGDVKRIFDFRREKIAEIFRCLAAT